MSERTVTVEDAKGRTYTNGRGGARLVGANRALQWCRAFFVRRNGNTNSKAVWIEYLIICGH